MNKILLTIICAMVTMFGFAQSKDFKGNLVVTVNGQSTEPQETVIHFELNEDMTCNFALNNFMLDSGDGNYMAVGNIRLQNLPLAPAEDGFAFGYDDILLIEEGDLEGVDAWLGPLLGELPLKLKGVVSQDKMVVTIDIDLMDTLGQIIHVSFESSAGGSDIDLSNALSFTDNLVVTVNGVSTDPQETTVYIAMNEDGTCNFVLKNFCLDSGDGNIMPVGNIFIPNLTPTYGEDGLAHISYEDNLLVTEGDMEGVDTWLGPLLGEIPLKLIAKSDMQKIFVTIDIDMMSTLGQIIYVQFGSDFGKGDDEDCVRTIQSAGAETPVVYDFMGRRVSGAAKGMYIVNGKKVVR